MTDGPGPRCWAERLLDEVSGDEREIVAMYLSGPESKEYTHTDVYEALQSMFASTGNALYDIGYEGVKHHRRGRCRCRRQRGN